MPALLKFIISVSLPLIAGSIGGFFTSPNIPTWYASLNKPTLNPPNFIFAPIWTLLYLCMGISFYLIWTKKSKKKKPAYTYYLIQLALNLIWSYLFFSLRLPPLALVEIVVLWFAILLTILKFYKLSPKAAKLLIPYLLWVTFATYLNYEIVRLN